MKHPNHFPDVVDNTMRTGLIVCETMARYEHIDCLFPTAINWDLHAGKAFASAIEQVRRSYYIERAPEAVAILAGKLTLTRAWANYVPPSSYYKFKTLDRLLPAIDYYFLHFPLDDPAYQPYTDSTGEKMVEANRLFPLPIAHPVTGNPLLFSIRFDLLAGRRLGQKIIVDEKLIGKISDEWALKFDMDSQVSAYLWATNELYPDQEDEIHMEIRGISVLKNDISRAVIPVYRPRWVLDRWYGQMVADFQRWVRRYQEAIRFGPGVYDMNLGDACTAFNRPCDYLKLCMSPNPERLIEHNYTEVPWNPITRDR